MHEEAPAVEHVAHEGSQSMQAIAVVYVFVGQV